MKHIFANILIFILFLSSAALASPKVIGHMTPLPSETLATPISLKECPGLSIDEWRGSAQSSASIARLNAICVLAIKAFPNFIALKGMHKHNNEHFWYNIALIPDNKQYRGMNDIQYRFINRFVKYDVWAYTSRDKRYIFMVSSIGIKEMPCIFAHELFHAMSMHYGIFNAHASTDTERVQIDEEYAQEFTEYLGLGR